VIAFETGVRIERPVEEVFAIVSDPLRFPLWNSAVQAVSSTSPGTSEAGSTYSMERELPGGPVENEIVVLTLEPPVEFDIRTLSGPTPFVYRYRFHAEGDATLIRLDASVELPAPAALIAPLAARAVKRGVDDNLAALRRLLEGTG
jgi:uncharacterized membrane protein